MIRDNKAGLFSLVYKEETEDPSGKELYTHFHNSYEIIYIVRGIVQFTINDRIYICKHNSMLFLNNLEKHERSVLEYPYLRYILLIKPDRFNDLINDPLLLSLWKQRPEHFVHLLNLADDEISFINDIFAKMLIEFDAKMPFWENAIGAYLYLFLGRLFRNHRTYFPFNSFNKTTNIALMIQKYLEEHATEEILLKETAKMFNIDMYYLSHIFKQVIGYTFKEYMTLQRISFAKDLLANSSMNITEICMSSGFSNLNQFIRAFKKHESITPYQFRKDLSR